MGSVYEGPEDKRFDQGSIDVSVFVNWVDSVCPVPVMVSLYLLLLLLLTQGGVGPTGRAPHLQALDIRLSGPMFDALNHDWGLSVHIPPWLAHSQIAALRWRRHS